MGDSWSGIVDVGSKPKVEREAIATGMILLKPESMAVSYTHLTLPTILLV